jgi:hypothetical protein
VAVAVAVKREAGGRDPQAVRDVSVRLCGSVTVWLNEWRSGSGSGRFGLAVAVRSF